MEGKSNIKKRLNIIIVIIVIVFAVYYLSNVNRISNNRLIIARDKIWSNVIDFLDDEGDSVVGVEINSPSLIIPVESLFEFLSIKEDVNTSIIYCTSKEDDIDICVNNDIPPDIWLCKSFKSSVNLYIFNSDMAIAYRYKLRIYVNVVEIYENGNHTESWIK